ncbi:MAG: DUF58 domain-containing protein [Anaerolineales bacterium]
MMTPEDKIQVHARDLQSVRKFNSPALPWAIAVFTIFYFLGGFRGWLFLLIGTSGLWILAFVWARSLQAGLRIERRVRSPSATVGQRVEERLTLVNESRMPAVWVEIVDRSDNVADPVKLVTDVSGSSSRTRWPTHRFARRGVYSLGPTSIRTGDPFGIYTVTTGNPASASMIVLAPTVDLTRVGAAAGGWTGSVVRGMQSSARHIGQSGVQEYVPGDSLRRIHWPATAHRGELIVRKLESVTAKDWWVIVDLEGAAHVGVGWDSTLELAVVVAASLCAKGMGEGRKVGLALAGPEPTVIPLGSGPHHSWRLQAALACVEVGIWPLEDLLRSPACLPRSHATKFVVTASTRTDWVGQLRPGNRGGAAAVYLLDRSGFGGPSQSAVARALRKRRLEYIQVGRETLRAAYPDLSASGRPRRVGDRVIPIKGPEGQPAWPPAS